MNLDEFAGKTALVTGASSGLGADFARQLGAAGCNLVLVARRKENMDAVKQEIAGQHDVRIATIAMDLNEAGAARALHDRLRSDGVDIDILVNNAGFGMFGRFLEMDLGRLEDMLNLDMIVPTQLTHLIGNAMAERGGGYILQISSIGGYQATPSYAAYSAAKAYILLLGEALNVEFKRKSVTCTVLAPGVTKTEFLDVAGQQPTLYQRFFMMDSDKAVRTGLKALLKGKQSVIPGIGNKLVQWSGRLTPRPLLTYVAQSTMKGPGY